MIKKYYYNFNDVGTILELILTPYNADSLEDVYDAMRTHGEPYFVNIDDSTIEELWQNILVTYRHEYLFKIEKPCNEEPTQQEVSEHFEEWLINLIQYIYKTQEYYFVLYSAYEAEKANLMADIKALSKNKVKFNDTPQNANTDDVYEGDDYITHFTATEGETSSPLMSKIMRLKEIQDHFKNIMGDWVKDCEKLFIEGGNL